MNPTDDTPSADFAPESPEQQKTLDTLYDAPKPLPPPRNGALTSYTLHGEILKRRGPELSAQLGEDIAAQAGRGSRYDVMGRDLPDNLTAMLMEAEISADLSVAHVKTEAEAEADTTTLMRQIQANNAELRERFAQQYGARDGEELLARTQRFVRSRPLLAGIMKKNGIGSRPDIVEAVAAFVFSSGWRG
jgi:hypothetical protein